MTELYKDTLINGPVSIIRLEGVIGKIKKVIYLFGDYHLGCDQQSTCNNDDAINIDKFFSDTFKKLNSDVDFFMETSPFDTHMYKQSGSRVKYILDLRNFFGRNFNVELSNDKNHRKNTYVRRSEKYPHVSGPSRFKLMLFKGQALRYW